MPITLKTLEKMEYSEQATSPTFYFKGRIEVAEGTVQVKINPEVLQDLIHTLVHVECILVLCESNC